MAAGPASPGTQASRIAAHWLAARSRASGRPADHDEHDRRAGRDDRLEQLLLAAEKAEVEPVAELARSWRRRSARSARRGRRSRRRASRASLDGRGEVRVGAVADAAPRRVADLAWPAERCADGVEHRRPARRARRPARCRRRSTMPQGVALHAQLPERLDVDEVAVVAERARGRCRRCGPMTASRAGVGAQRQDAVVLDQHERAASQLEGDARPRRPASRPRARRSSPARRRTGCSNRPRRNFSRSTRPTAASMSALVDAAVGDGRGQRSRRRRRSAAARRRRRPAAPAAAASPRSSVRRWAVGQHLDRDVVGRPRCRRSPSARAGSSSAARARRGRAARRRRSRRASSRRARRRAPRPRTGTSCSSWSSRGPDVRGRLVHAALGQPVPDQVLAGRHDARRAGRSPWSAAT